MKNFIKDNWFSIGSGVIMVIFISGSFDFQERRSTAILSHIRLFDSKRLKYIIGKMSVGDYKKIKEKLIELIQ